MNDLIRKIVFIAVVVLAWDNRHAIASFIAQCWEQGVTVAK
jgi:hypothetical protein